MKEREWTIKVRVNGNWIEDGFVLTSMDLKEAILEVLLQYAKPEEVNIEIVRDV